MVESKTIFVTASQFNRAVEIVLDICETGNGRAESAVRQVAEVFGITVSFEDRL